MTQDALLVEVKSGKIRHVPWRRIHINDDGYLFVPDKNGELVWVQLVNWQLLSHNVEAPRSIGERKWKSKKRNETGARQS